MALAAQMTQRRTARYLALGDPAVAEDEDEDLSLQDRPGFQDEDDQMLEEARPPVQGPILSAPPTDDGAPEEAPIGTGNYIPVESDSPYISPDIPFQGGIEKFSPGPMPAPAPRYVGGDTTLPGSLETMRQVAATEPVLTKPKWWQKVAAAGFGAGAGWSNAASRTRNPIDIAKGQEAILHPGYSEQQAEFQSRMAPAEKQVEILGQQVGSELAQQKGQSEAQLKRAQAEAAMAHGAYWTSRSEQERNQWKVDSKTGELYNTITGQVSRKPPTAKDRYETAIALHATPVEAREYALSGKITARATPSKTEWQSYLDANGGDSTKAIAAKQKDEIARAKDSRDPLTDVLRQDMVDRRKQADLEAIGQTKLTSENRITQQREADLRAIDNSPIDDKEKANRISQINGSAARQLQNVQNTYALNARAHGVQAEDWDVGVDGNGNISYAPRPVRQAGTPGATAPVGATRPPAVVAPPPQSPPGVRPVAAAGPTPAGQPHAGAPPTYTEALVRQKAIALGKNPDAAVTAARLAKFIP